MGGIDWSGMPYVVELLGIDNVEVLLQDLLTIKHHRPRQQGDKANE